jgi:uncharacterized protein (DUF2147 family)
MRQRLPTLALGVVGTLLFIEAAIGAPAGVQATRSAPTAAGVWQVDDDGKMAALVTITEERGVYVGRLSRLFLDPAADPNPICTECLGDKHNQPLLGLTFIERMTQAGLDYDGGTILDPETGNIYSASMRLSPDGTTLTVRGYLGLSIFGRSQTWNRVQ